MADFLSSMRETAADVIRRWRATGNVVRTEIPCLGDVLLTIDVFAVDPASKRQSSRATVAAVLRAIRALGQGGESDSDMMLVWGSSGAHKGGLLIGIDADTARPQVVACVTDGIDPAPMSWLDLHRGSHKNRARIRALGGVLQRLPEALAIAATRLERGRDVGSVLGAPPRAA